MRLSATLSLILIALAATNFHLHAAKPKGKDNTHRVNPLKSRFLVGKESEAPVNSSKIRNLSDKFTTRPGEFLGRMWTLFGRPLGSGYEGFAYLVKDTQSKITFEVYFGASGAAYGCDPKISPALIPVLEAFDALLESTKPADCELEFENDFGKCKIGVKHGIPFSTEISES